MRTPRNSSFILIGMAICDAMRHTGTSVVTSDISAQMNGPRIEMVPDLIQEARKLETQYSEHTIKICLEPVGSGWYPSLVSNTKDQRRDNFTRPIHNTAPLKHYKNPRRPRRG